MSLETRASDDSVKGETPVQPTAAAESAPMLNVVKLILALSVVSAFILWQHALLLH